MMFMRRIANVVQQFIERSPLNHKFTTRNQFALSAIQSNSIFINHNILLKKKNFNLKNNNEKPTTKTKIEP